ncbi:hypothetical protein RN053_21210 [Pantoea dispersa]|uniref:hypothetical protein n=1 Tax=Pantoea dispersa TaxID=59814 RepID=UPI0028DFE8D0|nr:hypothetical protein [Pantoea dispersa]MDT8853030.1 hypothetical protein [Pantoea dispersa]
MKPLSERLKTFSASQFIDWLCLACVDVREVHTPYDAQEEINKIREALTERLSTLQEQLTATTNSLTNAQEALKSAGIEADTVQAGVMGLKAQRDAIAAENAALETFITQSCYSYDGDGSDVCDSYVGADESPFFPKTPATKAYLNAVRADAVEDVAKRLYGQGYNFEVLTRFAAHLRTGNAGKDGRHE